MTKKKALVYLLIFLILVSITAAWKHFYLKNPAAQFPDECKLVIAPSCQTYINKISKEKKYDEVIKIQKVRISENEKILNVYKWKLSDKTLLFKTKKETLEELKTCIDKPCCKRDLFLLGASDLTIRDIVFDSLIVAEIELKEFNNEKAALKTLRHAKKVVKNNKYFYAKDAAINAIDMQIAQIEPIKNPEKQTTEK